MQVGMLMQVLLSTPMDPFEAVEMAQVIGFPPSTSESWTDFLQGCCRHIRSEPADGIFLSPS